MRILKRMLLFVMIATVLPLTAIASTGTYSDTAGHWASEEIERWSDYGILYGYGGKFRPNDPITRAEVSAIINRLMLYRITGENTFTDLDKTSWYYDDMIRLIAAGVVLGANNLARPQDNITREECAVMFGRAFRVPENAGNETKFTDAADISLWAQFLVFGMEAQGYVRGTGGKFYPRNPITRAEVVKMVDNMIAAYYFKPGEYTGTVNGNVLINTPGVTLKNMTINGNLYLVDGIADGTATLSSVNVKGWTYVRGGGDPGIIITENSEFTFMDVCKPDSPVSIRVTGGAKPAFNALPPREGLAMSEEQGGMLNVEARDVILDLRYKPPAAPAQSSTLPPPPPPDPPVNPQATPSSIATVTSLTGVWTVNNFDISSGTLTILDGATTVNSLLAGLEKHQGATWKVAAANMPTDSLQAVESATEKSSGSALAPGDKLCVVAEDGITYNVYTITFDSQPGTDPPAPPVDELSGSFSLPASIHDFQQTLLTFTGPKANPQDIVAYEYCVGDSPAGPWTELSSVTLQFFVNDARHKVFVRLKASDSDPAGPPIEIGPIQVANVQLRQGPSIEDIVGTIAQGTPVHGVAGMIDFENTLITIPFEFDYCTDYTGFGYHAGTAQPVRFADFVYLRYRESSNPELPASYVSNYSFYRASTPNFTTPGNFRIQPGTTPGTAKITVPASMEYKIVKAGTGAAATGADIVQNWTFGNPSGEDVAVTEGDQVYIRVAAVPFVTRHDDRYYNPYPGDGSGNIIAFGRFKSNPSTAGYAITQHDIN